MVGLYCIARRAAGLNEAFSLPAVLGKNLWPSLPQPPAWFLQAHPESMPDDAHNRSRFPADKTSHNYNFSLTASVVDGSILDFSINSCPAACALARMAPEVSPEPIAG